MVFKMTDFDAAIARVGSIVDCPVARVVSRTLNLRVRVFARVIRIPIGGPEVGPYSAHHAFALPPHVIEFIRMTDLGLMPKPITFVLDVEGARKDFENVSKLLHHSPL